MGKLYEEYLRRNLLVASAYGASANAQSAIDRLKAGKRPPKWLLSALEGIVERTDKLPLDLARWRSLAVDRPDYVTPDEDPGRAALTERAKP